MAQRLKIQGSLQTRAAFEPSTFDEKANTVEVVFTTGARGKRFSWSEGDFYEELEVSDRAVDLSRLNNGAPYLNAHAKYDCRDVIGVVERAWIAGSEGRALIRFSERDDVKPIRDDVKNGILRHTSVGYSIQKLEKIEEVEGVPVYRATRWTPAEISQVPMGFDDHATVRGRTEPEFYEVEIEERAMSVKTNTEPGNAAAAPPVAAAPAVTPASTEDATRAAAEAATRAERERAAGIMQVVTRAKLGDAFATELVAKGVTVDQARAAVLDALATRDEQNPIAGQVRVGVGDDSREKFIRGGSARMIQLVGATDLIRRAMAKQPDLFGGKVELDASEFRGLSPRELARESLERQGVKTRSMSPMEMAGAALHHRSGMQTTSDFSVLFENAMHKILLASYALQEDTWSKFCKVDTVADFRPSNRYRAGSLGPLDELNEHGEFKNKPIPDGQKTAISVGTKGNIIALTRQAIINDDMGALANLAQELGSAARHGIEIDVYALLKANAGLGPTHADGQPFFHSNRANVNATGAALSVAGINADATIMARQKDTSGNRFLNLRPAVMLVPTEHRAEANVLNDAQFDPADNKLQKPNTVRGMFREVVATPELTGNRRYLFADPAIAAAIVVAFLEGQGQAPVLERQDGWRIDGVEWKVRLDYKAQVFDPKGAVTNAGQ